METLGVILSRRATFLRQLLSLSLVLLLASTSVGCGISSNSGERANAPANQTARQTATPLSTRLADGQYPVQQASYEDASGEYRLLLLNTGAQASVFRSTQLPMARLSDEAIAKGEKSYLQVENGKPTLYLTEDFRIEYVHTVAQTVENPQTGEQERVVVRQETGFWAPFAGALAGQALGSLLFTPHYYFPPVYQPGRDLVGYGGYGRSYGQAVDRYQQRYQSPPPEVRNRQAFRTTGQLRSPTYGQPGSSTRRTPSERSTGSGYGSSTLRSSPNTRSYRSSSPAGRRSSFGTGRSRSGSRR